MEVNVEKKTFFLQGGQDHLIANMVLHFLSQHLCDRAICDLYPG
jgi:hypothetical protein